MSIKLLGTAPERLMSEGLEVHLVANMSEDDPSRVSAPGVISHHFDMVRRPAPLRDVSAILRSIVLLSRVKPTLVVAGTPKAALIFMIAALITQAPARVYFLFGLRLETTRNLSRVLFWVIERATASAATHVIAVSHSLRQKFVDSRLSKASKVVILGHGSSKGVDLTLFRPARKSERVEVDTLNARLGLTPGVPTVGFFGRISEDKGIHALNGARILLAERGIDHQLLVAGPNETLTAEPFVTHLRLRPAIRLGQIGDLAPLYRLLDILFLPTLREGLPNVCLEASASGVAVVKTTATGAIDSIQNGLTGVLVRPGSSEELANALELLIRDPPLRKRLAKEGRKWVEKRFDEKSVEDRYSIFFKGLLSVEPN